MRPGGVGGGLCLACENGLGNGAVFGERMSDPLRHTQLLAAEGGQAQTQKDCQAG